MSVTALLLVLASAFVHASWNAILKRCRKPELAVLACSIAAACFAVLVAIPFVVARGPGFGNGNAFLWCLAAGVLEALYFQTLGRALARGTLGLVYTISRGGSLLVVWPISILFLGETLTVTRAAGTACVLVGLCATGLATSPRASEPARNGAVALAVLTGVFIGGYNLAYKKALAGGVAPTTANAISLGFAGTMNLIGMGAERRRLAFGALREQPFAIGISGFLGATGFLLFLAALAGVGAGVVATLRNTSILFAQMLGFFLGERPPRIALMGTVAVAAGAILLAL